MLSFIPTPIGNKEDITLRALRLLKECEVLFCEDTRTTKNLYRMYDISYSDKKLLSYTSYSKNLKAYQEIIKTTQCGVVSEAWCPWLSDPWKSLIKLCRDHALPFEILPGANALIPTVVATPIDTSAFIFMWFVPHKKGRQTFVKKVIDMTIPVYCYESVHRIKKLLDQLDEMWYTWTLCLWRELTKKFEEFRVGSVSEMKDAISNWQLTIKWEFVVWFFN